MRKIKNINLNEMVLKPHNIVITYTSEIDYEMERYILIEDLDELKNDHYDEYLLLEGYHCSCYSFDDTKWDAMIYTEDDLLKLANAPYNKNNKFWNMVRAYFNK